MFWLVFVNWVPEAIRRLFSTSGLLLTKFEPRILAIYSKRPVWSGPKPSQLRPVRSSWSSPNNKYFKIRKNSKISENVEKITKSQKLEIAETMPIG